MADKKKVQLKACVNGDIKIIVDGEQTGIIHDNQTSDSDIFAALKYEPRCKYEWVQDKDIANPSGVNRSVFEAISGLFNSIIKGINEINESSSNTKLASETDDKNEE